MRGGVHAELELGLLAVVGGETLEKESAETRTSATTEGVEDEEALQTSAVVGEAAKLVHYGIDLLLADGVVTTSVYGHLSDKAREARVNLPLTVACGVFLARHKSLGMEETPVGTVANLVDDIGLEVNVERPRHMLARGRLREKGAETIIVRGRGPL